MTLQRKIQHIESDTWTDFDMSIDIEATGLNPWEDRVVSIGLVDARTNAWFYDDPDRETVILEQIEEHMRQTRIDTLVGWNNTEFDLPFLAVRMVLNGIDMVPFIKPSGLIGKYGKPRYEGAWYGATFDDTAYLWEKMAKDHGVRWSLKAFAKFMGLDVVEMDFSTKSILDLDKEERERYCISDARLAMELWKKAKAKKVSGQAVKLEGDISFL